MRAPSELLWRLLPGVRPRERGRFLYFGVLAGVLSLAQTLGIAASEALFLARVGAEWLPAAFVVAAAATVLGSFLYALSVGRVRNDLLFVRLLVAGVLFLAVAIGPAAWGIVWIYPVLLCFFFLTQAIYVNHYWTFTWDFFDTLASKRLFPLFVIGNSVGGALGGAGVAWLSQTWPPEVVVGGWAVALIGTALQLRLGRRALRRWGPLELEESDEASLEAIQASVRFVRSSPLARWLVLSTVGMVLALFTSQYLYSELLVRSFPTASGLAAFLGAFLLVTNVLEIAVEGVLTPWLIRRLGVASANLAHPLLTVASFAWLALDFSLVPALGARANREMLENGIAQPVRVLVYNSIPARFRGRLRVFQEGVVFYAGMAGAGALLLAVSGRIDAIWICLAGAAMAVLYLGANLVLRSEYLRTLVARLREGRLDLGELGGDLGGFEAMRLARLWESALAGASATPSTAELELPTLLVRRGVVEPVIRALDHPSPRLRRVCLDALAPWLENAGVAAEPGEMVARALEDPDPGVRLAAAQAAHPLVARHVVEAALRARADDPDPEVRAETALALGTAGHARLAEMVDSRDPPAAVAALRRLPPELVGSALAHTRDAEPAVRAAALECAARLASPVPLDSGALASELAHPSVRVRRAAVAALATHADAVARAALARALEDPSGEVRRAAEQALGAAGDAALSAIAPYVASERSASVQAAIAALGAINTQASRALLGAELRRRVRDGWWALLALRLLPESDRPALRVLRAAWEDGARESQRLAFAILERLEDPKVMRTVARVLRVPRSRSRADALEVLSNLGDREAAQMLVLMLEGGPIEDKLAAIAPLVRPPGDLEEAIADARNAAGRWLRVSAAHYTGAGGDGIEPADLARLEELMDRLLVLREVGLFGSLSLEQLEVVSRVMSEARYLKDEVICREGDLGGELYVLVDGEVRMYKNWGTPGEIQLSVQRPVSYFGEMAILADETRSATVTASADATLLVLGGEQLKDLILERPEISFEIFRVLTARVRTAEDRL